MIVYVNDRNEICAVGNTDNPNLTQLEILDDEINPFKYWSEAKICCYKVNVSDGVVTMMTPYVDSRLIVHIDQLGLWHEENVKSIMQAEQTITDMDLAQIETEQQMTDMDIRILELEEIINE